MASELKVLDYKATGLNIHRAIEASGLTYSEIARALELESTRVIYEWIQGNKLPTLPRMVALASILSVNIEDLLSIE